MGVWIISSFRWKMIKVCQEVKIFSKWLKIEYVIVWGVLSLWNFNLKLWVKTITDVWVIWIFREKLFKEVNSSKIFSKWLKIEYVVVWGVLSLWNFHLKHWVRTLMGVWVIWSFRWAVAFHSYTYKAALYLVRQSFL